MVILLDFFEIVLTELILLGTTATIVLNSIPDASAGFIVSVAKPGFLVEIVPYSSIEATLTLLE